MVPASGATKAVGIRRPERRATGPGHTANSRALPDGAKPPESKGSRREATVRPRGLLDATPTTDRPTRDRPPQASPSILAVALRLLADHNASSPAHTLRARS